MLAFSFLRFIPTPILARQDFPGQVAGWLGGWLRKAENKAKAQQSWGLGFAELGNSRKHSALLLLCFDEGPRVKRLGLMWFG